MIRIFESRTAAHCFAAIAGWALMAAADVAAQDDQIVAQAGQAAVAVVQQLQNALVQAADLSDVHARFDFLTDVVTTTHDLDYIGQLTVRRQWRDWTPQQRTSFLSAFTSLSIMSYAARFANVDAESFVIVGPQPAGNERIQVKTTVARADGTRVPLDFVLQEAGDGWRIANVIADGVSDLALRRAEYRTLLNDSGADGLVSELESQSRALTEISGE